MWNDTDIPLAVFFTFRCYGTWLHGDERGSVDRNNNKYGSPRIQANSNLRKHTEDLLLHPPVILNAASRKSVEKSIRDLCRNRSLFEARMEKSVGSAEFLCRVKANIEYERYETLRNKLQQELTDLSAILEKKKPTKKPTQRFNRFHKR